jgi:hypothetical protein
MQRFGMAKALWNVDFRSIYDLKRETVSIGKDQHRYPNSTRKQKSNTQLVSYLKMHADKDTENEIVPTAGSTE